MSPSLFLLGALIGWALYCVRRADQRLKELEHRVKLAEDLAFSLSIDLTKEVALRQIDQKTRRYT